MSSYEDAFVEPLFSIPIFRFNIKHVENFIFPLVKKINHHLNLESFNGENVSKLLTVEDNVLLSKELEFIKQEVYKNSRLFLYDVLSIQKDIKFRIVDSWIVALKPGGESTLHNHSYSYISGVIYLDVSETDSITFGNPLYNPGSGIFNQIITDFSPQVCNKYNSSNWTFYPKNSEGFLFLSSVAHRINKNVSNKNRISIAFNIMPTGLISTQVANRLNIRENDVETI